MRQAATRSRSRTRQPRIPGTVPPRIAAIQDAAEEYRVVRDERIALQQGAEKDAQGKLLKVMEKHGVEEYRYAGFTAFIEKGKKKAKVKSNPVKMKIDMD